MKEATVVSDSHFDKTYGKSLTLLYNTKNLLHNLRTISLGFAIFKS